MWLGPLPPAALQPGDVISFDVSEANVFLVLDIKRATPTSWSTRLLRGTQCFSKMFLDVSVEVFVLRRTRTEGVSTDSL